MDQTALYLAVTLIMEESVRRNAIAEKMHVILLQDVWCMVRNHIYQTTNPCTCTLIVLSLIRHSPYNDTFICITWHSLTQEKSTIVKSTRNDRVSREFTRYFSLKIYKKSSSSKVHMKIYMWNACECNIYREFQMKFIGSSSELFLMNL